MSASAGTDSDLWTSDMLAREADAMDPVKLFTVIVLISLPTVMFGGYALLDLLSKEKLTEFQRTYFRAGHAHAGVLLVMTLVALAVLDRTEFGDGARWVTCILLAVGVLAQSGGMFLHMAIGKPGAWSRANTLTTAGAVALAAGMLTTAYGVIIT